MNGVTWTMPWFVPCACGIILQLCAPDPEAANAQSPTPGDNPSVKRLDLEGLGQLYKNLELPLPPKDAGFAIVGDPAPWRFLRDLPHNDPSLRSDYRYRFGTEDPACKGRYLVWKCFDVEVSTGVRQFRKAAPSPEAVLQVMRMDRLDDNPHSPSEKESIFAIQCHLLGHQELAAFFYKRCQKMSPLPLEHWLRIDAWNYWVGKLHHLDADRADLVRKLNALVDRHRIFQPDHEIPEALVKSPNDKQPLYERQRAFLARLEWSLKPAYGARAKPGSAQRLMDEMVLSGEPPGSAPIPADDPSLWDRAVQIQQRRRQRGRDFQLSVAEKKVIALGFDAIPVMIEHVDDTRLTRHSTLSIGSSGPQRSQFDARVSDFQTVGHRIRHLLSAYFDLSTEIKSGAWNIKKSDYLAAWHTLSLMKETDFVARTITSKRDLNQFFILLLSARHPDQAIELYKKQLLNKHESNLFSDLTIFLIHSQLPKPEKLTLLSQGTQHPSPQYQVRSLEGLLELDDATFNRHCKELLTQFPKEWAMNDAAWHHVAILELAFCSVDPAIRELAYRQAKRMPAHARIALLAHLAWADFRPSKNLALSHMARFLDDQEVYRFDQKHTEGNLSSSFRGFEKIEVRNYAADQILDVLGIGMPLDDKTSDADWARIRDFVQEEVHRRLELEKGK